MKRVMLVVMAACAILGCTAAKPKVVKLPETDRSRSATLMQSLSERRSTREFSDKTLSLQDTGDLLWAANGINRADGKRTAPSAMNRQDIKVYFIDAKGAYLYDPAEHALVLISKGDFRQKVRDNMPVANVVLVADEDSRWAMIDAGYVSQNIYLFCAANGMATVACGSMDKEALTKALKLTEKQAITVQHPVGYMNSPL